MSIFASFLLILLLVVISAFLSCAEISIAASRKIRLEMMSKEGDANADRVLALQAQPGNFFTVVQIGLNAVAILGGVVGEPALTPHMRLIVETFYQGPWLESISFAMSFLAVTAFFILFADLMPKRLAMVAPERAAVALVKPMLLLETLFRPLVWFFNSLSKWIFTLFGLPQVRQEVITPNEIHAMVDAGAQAGVLLTQEHHLIENVFELESRYVPSAMTQRENIVYFLLNDSEETIQQKIIDHPHSRFLVCDGNIDVVLGYIDSKDVLKRLLKGERFSLADKGLVHSPLSIPDSLNLWEVLERMKAMDEDLAIVVNEYALVVGIISITDVTNVLMGNLLSMPEEEQQIVRRDENSWLMDGLTPLNDVMNELDIEEYPNPVGYETLAGFIMYMLRKIPKKTDFVLFSGFKFEAVDIEGNKINQLLVTRFKQEKSEPQTSKEAAGNL
ncbi:MULTISPECIES: hemolysin family protein [unclassified Herbaspirillum]|uniref:hemolysin family protein n=1 Tax=unclassified Herbaspirillum TaxID=2624150 RepID=UPI00115259D8|nr:MULTISPECIES: hemolysin family protein [unclassified Herbaspirillum]MBB5392143.1 CBS domain containing-hemolysin-like protein [Herbaspirillum sp. SJZ102]TQK13600.1 CBS domain containing-hemolysin-like protein [Herbaspirillum sp. SJZ130]TQK15603.1 CBS domain containing-hemolysin-like protein [Herbaspirillum sp. SJZ106]TWC71502.1 CBS domain containing-hemolysin-like protein [Herbaspirillum sp. SJZ099]